MHRTLILPRRTLILPIAALVGSSIAAPLPVAGLSPVAGPLLAAAASEPSMAHSSYLNAVSCPTATVCVAVGAFETDRDSASGKLTGGSFQALAVRTTNGGKTWAPVGLPSVGADLSSVSCWSAAQCVAVGATQVISRGRWWASGGVVVRIEGSTGSRVAALPPGAPALETVSCPSATTCIAAGGALKLGTVVLQPEVMVSHDGGASWASATLPITQGQLESVSCSSSSHCVALGASSYSRSFGSTGSEDSSKAVGLVSSSSGGGLSWELAAVPGGSGGPTAVSCQSAGHCLAVGDSFNWCWCGTSTPGHYGETWVTANGGATWREQVLPTLDGYVVWYANAVSCWATGCAMVGTATTTKLGSGYYAIFQPLSASGGPLGAPSTSASRLRPQYIYGLSCRNASSCIAVGQNWSNPRAAAIETWAAGRWVTRFTGPAAAPGRPSQEPHTLVAATPCPGPAQVSRPGVKDRAAPHGSLFDGTYRLGPGDGSQNPTSGKGPFGRLDGVYADILVCAPHPDKLDTANNTSAWVMLQKFGVAADHWQVGWEWYPKATNRDPAILVEIDQPGPSGGGNAFADCDNLAAASSLGLTCYTTPCSETTSSKCSPTLKVGYYAFFTVLYNGTTFSAYVGTEDPLTGKYSGPKEVAQVKAKFVPNQGDISAETHYIDDQMPGTARYPERFINCHVYVPGSKWVPFDGHEKFNGGDVFFTTVDGVSSSSWFGQSNPSGQELLVWDKDAA
jgi:hypothetical protein